MAYRKFQFAGVRMDSPARHDLSDGCGTVRMDFSVLVSEMVGDDTTGSPFSVGTVSVCRINFGVLDLSRNGFLDAIDETAGTHEWASLTTDEYSEAWGNAYGDKYALDGIFDFLGIESAYIDAQFRSKRLIGFALRDMAAITGFGPHSAMILLAQPWSHLSIDADFDDPRYLGDLESLTASYERVGFKRLCASGMSNALTLSGDYKNKAWEKLWRVHPKTFRVKNFDPAGLILSLTESQARNRTRIASS